MMVSIRPSKNIQGYSTIDYICYFFNSNNTFLTISSTCASIEADGAEAGNVDAPPVKFRLCAGSSVEPA